MILTALLLAQLSLTGQASVIDGDTIEIQGTRIRIHGIDAPESRQTCKRDGKNWRCGQQSALSLSSWIGNQTVTCSQVATDRYKRVVARCSVRGEDIARWSVANGWALDWPQYSRGEYAAVEESAKRLRLGLHSGTFVNPWEWRKK